MGGVQRSVAELSGWVAFRDEAFKQRREAAWRHEIEPAIADLRAASWLWGDLASARMEDLSSMLSELEKLEKQVESLTAGSPDPASRQLVEELMAKRVIPEGRRLVSFLRGISSGQVALMEVDATSVSLISRVGVVLSVLLIAGMIVLAWVTSERGADEITRPISRLARATEELGAGRLTEDIPIADDDEIGQLTAAFNVMRASLVQATESIRQTASQLTDATAQIMAATTQQAKGTREQTAAIRTTVGTVEEIAQVANAVAQRARGVCDSVESAATATAAGRIALEGWISGMARLQDRLNGDLSAKVTGSDEVDDIVTSLRAHMRQVQETMEKLVQLLSEAENMATTTGSAVETQAARLIAAQKAMQQVDSLAGQTFERTIQVEHVAQHLKARSRALRELLSAYSMYAPPSESGDQS